MPTPTETLLQRISSKNALQDKYLRKSVELLTIAEHSDLDAYIQFCLDAGDTIDDLTDAYLLIVIDTLREQAYFRRHKRYRHSRFSEVAESVYFDPTYMKRYMLGLALSVFLWPNHLKMKRFFAETLPKDGRAYLEVGPGHGFFMMHALRQTNHARVLGVDISPTSVELTKSILASPHFGALSGFEVVECDLLEWKPTGVFDTIVMGEVLEHVEQPLEFLRALHRLAHDDTHVFVTTCFNAPAVDHIYLYRNIAELEEQVQAAGFDVANDLQVPSGNNSLAECIEQELPVNVAMVLKKRAP